jgi:hypothetical protein
MLIGTAAKAEGHEPAHMNFNAMIDANNAMDAGLTQDLSDHYTDKKEEAPKQEAQEEKAVDDFITYEVHHVKKDKVAADEKTVSSPVLN